MPEKIPRIIPEVNKASESEIKDADSFLTDSVLNDSGFDDTDLPDFRLKDFQDKVPGEVEKHDFLNSDTLKNSQVIGFDLTEAPGDLRKAQAELHRPQQPARITPREVDRPRTISGLLNDHSQTANTIGNSNTPAERARARKEAARAPKTGLFTKLKKLFGG
jgi:hypothetical protein